MTCDRVGYSVIPRQSGGVKLKMTLSSTRHKNEGGEFSLLLSEDDCEALVKDLIRARLRAR
tara:strand:- start:4346 stop:4528 length:183 start_codon:yes stop_codon:yes gene_type:complete